MKKKYLQSSAFNSLRAVTLLLIIASLSACVSRTQSVSKSNKQHLTPDLICQSADRYKNKVVGDGHCVSLIKRCSGAPTTGQWRPGAPVLNSQLPSGTVIATFKNGRYPNTTGYHAAIYIKHDRNGIWVWDQWVGKAVHKRLIRIRNDNASPGNTAQDYKVVRIN